MFCWIVFSLSSVPLLMALLDANICQKIKLSLSPICENWQFSQVRHMVYICDINDALDHIFWCVDYNRPIMKLCRSTIKVCLRQWLTGQTYSYTFDWSREQIWTIYLGFFLLRYIYIFVEPIWMQLATSQMSCRQLNQLVSPISEV